MKRLPSQRLTSFLPKPKPRLGVVELEQRDVPAVFFVDPTYAGGAPVNNYGGVAAANFGSANAGNTYNNLDAAINTAAANGTADTIYIANGTVVALNTGGTAKIINDNLSLVGSGKAATQIVVGFQAADQYNDFVFQVGNGKSLNLQDLTYNGNGVNDNGVIYDSSGVGSPATGVITNVAFTGAGDGFNPADPTSIVGNAIWVRNGSNVKISGSSFLDNQGDASIYITGTTATPSAVSVDTSTFTGNGPGANRNNYGIVALLNSKLTVTNSTFTNNLASTPGAGSAGIFLSDLVGNTTYSPEATITHSTFTNNTVGVYVGNPGIPGDKSSANIAYNSFSGDVQYSIQGNSSATANGAVINARFNYFNNANGPTGADGVLGNVNTSQFLRAPLGTVVANQAKFITGANVSTGNPVTEYNSNPFTSPSIATGKTYNPADVNSEARVAYGDLTGDGVRDIVIGSSTSDTVQVYDGATGLLLNKFFALTTLNKATNFAGGVYVAVGDINGDGKLDLVVSQGNYDPRIVVYNGTSVIAGAANPVKLRDFQDGYNRVGLSLGVSVAVGDFNGDGFDDIATGVASFNNSNVRVYDGKFLTTGAQAGLVTGRSVIVTPGVDFYAYPGYAVSALVAAGDVNGDGRADLVTGTTSLGANVREFTFAAGSILAPTVTAGYTLAADFIVGAQNAGVRVAVRDLNNDGYSDILYTLGSGAPPVSVVDGKSLTAITPPYVSKAVPPAGSTYTLLTAAYTATSKGAWIA